MFFYSISWNPDLGPRNDWDLLSLPALPLSLLAKQAPRVPATA